MAAKEELWAGPEQLLASAVVVCAEGLTSHGCWLLGARVRGVAHNFRKIFLPRAGNGKPESL